MVRKTYLIALMASSVICSFAQAEPSRVKNNSRIAEEVFDAEQYDSTAIRDRVVHCAYKAILKPDCTHVEYGDESVNVRDGRVYVVCRKPDADLVKYYCKDGTIIKRQ